MLDYGDDPNFDNPDPHAARRSLIEAVGHFNAIALVVDPEQVISLED